MMMSYARTFGGAVPAWMPVRGVSSLCMCRISLSCVCRVAG